MSVQKDVLDDLATPPARLPQSPRSRMKLNKIRYEEFPGNAGQEMIELPLTAFEHSRHRAFRPGR